MTLLRFSALLSTRSGVLRHPDSTSTMLPPTALPSSLLKLLASYEPALPIELRSRDFSFRSEPIAARLPELGLLERFPLRPRISLSSEETEKLNSASLPGVPLSELLFRSDNLSRPALTR